MRSVTDAPLASKPYISYRYMGRFGWIMIGATDVADALNEVRRSIDIVPSGEDAYIDRLQVWNGYAYEPIRRSDG